MFLKYICIFVGISFAAFSMQESPKPDSKKHGKTLKSKAVICWRNGDYEKCTFLDTDKTVMEFDYENLSFKEIKGRPLGKESEFRMNDEEIIFSVFFPCEGISSKCEVNFGKYTQLSQSKFCRFNNDIWDQDTGMTMGKGFTCIIPNWKIKSKNDVKILNPYIKKYVKHMDQVFLEPNCSIFNPTCLKHIWFSDSEKVKVFKKDLEKFDFQQSKD